MNIAAYLDLLGRPYTGSGPQALFLGQDKALAKKIFAFHGIRSPYFATSFRGKLDHADEISFPLIVKPTSEDGSVGIDAGSVVGSIKELMERIHYIQEEFDSPALIEEYIEGREIYAAVLGNADPEVLPLIELDLLQVARRDAPHRRHRGQVGDRDRGVSIDQVGARRRDGRRDGPATVRHGARGLPGSQASRLRTYRHAPHRQGGGVRHRGQPQPLDGEHGRARHGRQAGRPFVHAARRTDCRTGVRAVSNRSDP